MYIDNRTCTMYIKYYTLTHAIKQNTNMEYFRHLKHEVKVIFVIVSFRLNFVYDF